MLMAMKVLLVLAAITAAVYSNSIVEFQAQDGATCKMYSASGNSRAFIMECSCINTAGQKKIYTCSYYYKGEIEKCTDWQKVYDETSNELRGERQNCAVLYKGTFNQYLFLF